MTTPTLPLDLPEQAAPVRPVEKAVRCRFCRKDVGNDESLRAWRMCEPCFEGAEFFA